MNVEPFEIMRAAFFLINTHCGPGVCRGLRATWYPHHCSSVDTILPPAVGTLRGTSPVPAIYATRRLRRTISMLRAAALVADNRASRVACGASKSDAAPLPVWRHLGSARTVRHVP